MGFVLPKDLEMRIVMFFIYLGSTLTLCGSGLVSSSTTSMAVDAGGVFIYWYET